MTIIMILTIHKHIDFWLFSTQQGSDLCNNKYKSNNFLVQ